jgi:hypothetical protein
MRRSGAGILLVCASLTACASWQPVSVTPRRLVEVQAPSRIRVSLQDGRRLVLRDARLEGDSLEANVEARTQEPVRIRVALADIRRVDTWRGSDARSLGVALIAAPVVILAIWFIRVGVTCRGGCDLVGAGGG